MISERGKYALDLFTPVRHVATMIGTASPEAVSVKEMAAAFTFFSGGDLNRVRLNQQASSDEEAKEWLMEYAVSKIMRRGAKGAGTDQVVRENGGYRLADGVTFDDLEYDGKLIGHEPPDAHAQLRDPFNPLTGGAFAENIRAKGKDDLKELCESIEALGYVKDPGIVKDEHGVVLSGHRRLAAMEKLGIDPSQHVTTKRFGDGDEADKERLKFAIALNTAQKPFTPKDRKRIAEYLYGTGEYSMQQIGELLKVSFRTIVSDLEENRAPGLRNDGQRHIPKNTHAALWPAISADLEAGATYREITKKYGVSQSVIANAKKGALHKQRDEGRSSKIPEDQQQAFLDLVRGGKPQAEAVTAVTGKPTKTIPTSFRTILNREEGRLQALDEMATGAPPAGDAVAAFMEALDGLAKRFAGHPTIIPAIEAAKIKATNQGELS